MHINAKTKNRPIFVKKTDERRAFLFAIRDGLNHKKRGPIPTNAQPDGAWVYTIDYRQATGHTGMGKVWGSGQVGCFPPKTIAGYPMFAQILGFFPVQPYQGTS